ncbi:MAG: endonuclease/exonuclease/phosphatase family protein [Candidatus Obscuribacterales bacterium]|nr:endonuclease/exonuclease/phosphatase family protein [Candidatus Obscuribacterales bacterium]
METQPENIPAENAAGNEPVEGVKPSGKKKAKSKWSRIAFDISLTCAFVAAIVIGITVLGLMSGSVMEGDLGFICQQCANLRAQAAWVLLVTVIPPLFSLPWRPLAAVSMIFALINLALIAPVFQNQEQKGDKDAAIFSFKLLQMESGDRAFPVDDLVDLVASENPDIFTVCGINWDEMTAFNGKPNINSYPIRLLKPRQDGYGLGLYSKFPTTNMFVKEFGPDKIPVMFAAAKFEYGWVRILTFRAPQVSKAEEMKRRNQFLSELPKEMSTLKGPLLVCANLNSSPYTGAYQTFLSTSRLTDTRVGFGMQPNFYIGEADLYFNRVPNDYALANSYVGTASRWIAADFNSQHLPIVGKYFLREHKIEYKDLKVPETKKIEPAQAVKQAVEPEGTTSFKKKDSKKASESSKSSKPSKPSKSLRHKRK